MTETKNDPRDMPRTGGRYEHSKGPESSAVNDTGPEPGTKEHVNAPAGDGPTLADIVRANADLFESSEVLCHIARFAAARGAGSWATLGNVLVRTVLAVPHQVTLPPIIGGPVSLNPMLAVVGASGSGKDMAIAVADDAVLLTGPNGLARQWSPLPVGTGEGIGRSFATARRNPDTHAATVEFHCRSQLFGVRDIATLEALGDRRGQTLVPELLKAAHGQELGHANATLENRVILPPHSYRMGLTAGVQPGNGSSLVSEQSVRDGLTQRFLWLPVRDGVRRDPVAAPDPITVMVPDFGVYAPNLLSMTDDPEDESVTPPLVHIDVWEPIRREIVAINAAKDADLFGRSGDPMKGHRMLAQLKVSAALAVLHGRTSVGKEDWQRGAAVLAVSEAMADAVAQESRAALTATASEKGVEDGYRRSAADAAQEQADIKSVADTILRILRERPDQWTTIRTATHSLSAKRRRCATAAIEHLVTSGRVQSRDYEYQPTQFRIELRVNP